MLPTLHHGAGISNQSRLDYQQQQQQQQNETRNPVGMNNIMNNLDNSDSRLNKSRLLDYGGNLSNNYSNEHLHGMQNQSIKGANKYNSEYNNHLPHIRQND
jgi:hypothetical protein